MRDHDKEKKESVVREEENTHDKIERAVGDVGNHASHGDEGGKASLCFYVCTTE